MVKVEIYRLNNDGTQKIIAVCRLENNLVVCDGEEPFLDYLSKEGIKNYVLRNLKFEGNKEKKIRIEVKE